MNAQQRRAHRLKQTIHKLRAQNKGLAQQASPAFTGGPLSKGQADQLVSGAVKLKYGPQEQQFQGQIAGSDLRQGQLKDWFKQYQDTINQAQDQSNKANQSAHDALLANLQAAQGSQTASQGRTDAQMGDLSKITGGNFQQGPEASQAAQTTNSLSRQNLDALALQLANSTQGFGNQRTSASQQETSAHSQEGLRKANLQTQFRNLQGEKGAYGNQVRDQLRQQDFNQQIAQQSGLVKQQQLGLNAQLAGSLIGSRSDTSKHQRRQDRIGKKKFASAEEKDAYQRAHGLGPYKPAKGSSPKGHKGPTHSQKVSATEQLSTADSLIRTNPAAAKKAGFVATYNDLVVHHHIKPTLAHAATEKFFNGHYQGSTIAKVRKHYGVKLQNPNAGQSVTGGVQSIAGTLGLG